MTFRRQRKERGDRIGIRRIIKRRREVTSSKVSLAGAVVYKRPIAFLFTDLEIPYLLGRAKL